MQRRKRFLLIFALLMIMELLFLSVPSLAFYHYFSKPLIVLSLLFYFWSFHIHKKTRTLLTMALLFSLGGDVLLMFTNQYEIFFVLGLISFLLAHIFYSILFSRDRNKRINPLWVLIPLLSYGLTLMFIIRNGLGSMKIPVFVYMIVIIAMATFAYLRKGNVVSQSFLPVFCGALLFMLSDSMIAFDRFFSPIPYSGIWIMSTYGIAQFLIVTGILKNETGI